MMSRNWIKQAEINQTGSILLGNIVIIALLAGLLSTVCILNRQMHTNVGIIQTQQYLENIVISRAEELLAEFAKPAGQSKLAEADNEPYSYSDERSYMHDHQQLTEYIKLDKYEGIYRLQVKITDSQGLAMERRIFFKVKEGKIDELWWDR